MKFVCDRCQTRYSIADEKVRQRILRIRCKSCGNVITVQSGEVVPGPEDSSRRPESGGLADSPSASRSSSNLARRPSGLHEWFVAVDGAEKGPLSCRDAAKYVVSIPPEQSVHVWKEGMDSWKLPKDVAIIAQEITSLRRSSDSTVRPQALGSGPKASPAAGPGSGARLSQPGIPGSGAQVALPGSGPKMAPPPIPGSGLKVAPLPVSGSGPRMAPQPIPGSGPKAAPSAPGPGPGLAPTAASGPAPVRVRVSGSEHGGLLQKKGPALPGLTPPGPPLPSTAPVLETEFDTGPATAREQHPVTAEGATEFVTPSLETAQPTRPGESLAEDEFDQAEKTPPPVQPLAAIAASAGDGHAGKSWVPPSLPVPGPSATPLFGGTLPPAPLRLPEVANPSALARLAALFRRHGHFKYVVAATVVVDLVILMIVLSWRGEGMKAVPSVPERAARAPEVRPVEPVAETPPPRDDTAIEPESGHKGRTARGASKRRAAGRHEEPAARAAGVGEDPFEGPSPSSRRAERPIVPVEAPDQSRRSHSGSEVQAVTQSQISEVVRNKDHQSGLKTCYERALRRDGRLHTGRLDITVSVGVSGTVQRVQVHGPADFLIIDDCLKDSIRHWRFPPSTEEYATSFPLILQGDGP